MHSIDLSKYNIRTDLIIENNDVEHTKEIINKYNLETEYCEIGKNKTLRELEKAIEITKKGLERIWNISNPGLFEYNLKIIHL